MAVATWEQPTTRKKRRSSIWVNLFYAVGPHILLVLLWEITRLSFSANPKMMPSVGSMVGALIRSVDTGMLPIFVYNSLLRLAISGVISITIGVALGMAIGVVPNVAAYCMPVLRYFNSLSGIIWLPMFLFWFGFNEKTIISTISYTFIFPVVFNTVIGVRTVPKVYRNAVLTMGGSRWHLIKQVLIPGALPSIIAGTRLGFGYGWRAVISAEMLIGADGLGTMIFKAQSVNLTDRILAGMMIIGLIWSVMDYLVLQPLEEGTIERWGLTQR